MRKLATACAILMALAASAAAQTVPAKPKPIALLRHNIEHIARGVNANWGIYIQSLDTGEQVAIHAGRPSSAVP